MQKILRIGTRDSQLAVWQATLVKDALKKVGIEAELVYIKSEGDIDLITPLYEIGVEGIFTKSLDAALLNGRVDLAVHSLKDVPVRLAKGLQQAAVLERGSYSDIFVPHPAAKAPEYSMNSLTDKNAVIATSSIRRIAQWLHRFPGHKIENLRGSVNTRLSKLEQSNWEGAIFAAAGLERIGLRPQQSVDLDWMLPAPAQGAIVVVCREHDDGISTALKGLNHEPTAFCTKIEREFLKALLGGCSTPISALAQLVNGKVSFKGNILSPDGKMIAEVTLEEPVENALQLGASAARTILQNGGEVIIESIRNATR